MRDHCLLLLLVLLVAAPDEAGATCRSTCTEELRVCRARCYRAADRRACRQQCADASTCTAPGARIRTIAYTVNECRGDGVTASFHERLVVRRGNCDPVTLIDLPVAGPVPDPLPGIGICQLYGQVRIGAGGFAVSRFQRMTMTPDATGLVVEITNDHAVALGTLLSPEPPEEGIFYLRTDGRSLPDGRTMRRLAAPSAVRILDDTLKQVGFGLVASPNGRLVAFEDVGPDADGRDAQQIFLIDLAKDEGKKQLTRLSASAPGTQQTSNPFFADDHTIVFWNGPEGRRYFVDTNDGTLQPVQGVVANENSQVVPVLGIARKGLNVLPLRFPGVTPVDDYSSNRVVLELFVLDGEKALQLTRFGYSDTGRESIIGRDRIFFAASADPLGDDDPLGGNPEGICQLFSISPLGDRLRQLTHFAPDGRRKNGCWTSAEPTACKISSNLIADPVTGTVLFASSCDPLGRTRNGEQIFTMRPDGTGLRQITAFRGVEPLPDGGVNVEIEGNVAYSYVSR